MQSGTTDRATNIHRSRMYNIHDCSLGRSLVWCIQCIQSDPRTNAVMYGTHCVCVIYRILLYHKTAQKKTTHLHTKFVIKMELSWRTKNERKGKKPFDDVVDVVVVIWDVVCVWTKIKTGPSLCAIRPLNIYHLAVAVTYAWCFWCISWDLLFFLQFFFFGYCVSLLFSNVSLQLGSILSFTSFFFHHVIIMWHNRNDFW